MRQGRVFIPPLWYIDREAPAAQGWVGQFATKGESARSVLIILILVVVVLVLVVVVVLQRGQQQGRTRLPHHDHDRRSIGFDGAGLNELVDHLVNIAHQLTL